MVESVVDYAAWGKGYMPPSEHTLIDALSYRGAKVILSSSSDETGYWLVVKGLPKFRGRKLRGLMQQIEIILEEIEAEEAVEAQAAMEEAKRVILADTPPPENTP